MVITQCVLPFKTTVRVTVKSFTILFLTFILNSCITSPKIYHNIEYVYKKSNTVIGVIIDEAGVENIHLIQLNHHLKNGILKATNIRSVKIIDKLKY